MESSFNFVSTQKLFFASKLSLPFLNNLGRDEKGCKRDVVGLEKCSLVDVDQEKCVASMLTIDG